jgi:phenylalanyl-tRNA synthetase alpha chain
MSKFEARRKKHPITGGEEIIYIDAAEEQIFADLARRTDFDAKRLQRLYAMPDLTRHENSPVKFIIDAILALSLLKGFDVAVIPESISTNENFDVFDFPQDHPARSKSDTYFITNDRILRTHTTSMWLYYLNDSEALKKMEEQGYTGLLAHGKVYRKDEIDRKHFPVFHQLDGLYLVRREKKAIQLSDLQDVLTTIVQTVFGNDVESQFLEDAFPYTDPSTQIEVKFGGEWLELLGAGVVRDSTLEKLGVNSRVWNGWAFGFGVERLAMRKMNIPDIRMLWSDDPRITRQFTGIESQYEEVSKFPSVTRDISFIVEREVVPNKFYEIVRELGGDLIEEVEKFDEYENEENLGARKKSYTFRIIYRSFERTLTNEEVNKVHKSIEDYIAKELNAIIR